jgi:hypothetical protein
MAASLLNQVKDVLRSFSRNGWHVSFWVKYGRKPSLDGPTWVTLKMPMGSLQTL